MRRLTIARLAATWIGLCVVGAASANAQPCSITCPANQTLPNASTATYEIHVCGGAVGCGNLPVIFRGRGTVTFTGRKVRLTDKRDDRKVLLSLDLTTLKGSATATFADGTCS